MNSFRSLVLPLRLRDRYGLWSAAIAALCKWRFMTLTGSARHRSSVSAVHGILIEL